MVGSQTNFLICFLFTVYAIETISASRVLVVAPKLFRCNEEERILITAFDINKQPVPFQVKLEHATHGNLISDQKIYVSKDRPGMANLTVTLRDLTHRMSASSDVGEESHFVNLIITSKIFAQKKEIPVELNTGYIFIQTDKPIYNPAQTVKIRIVSLNEHMLPEKAPIAFSIQNPRGLILYSHQFTTSHPFINTTYELTEHPPLGNWTIRAGYSNGMQTRVKAKFLVQKYMLPVFEVKIQVEPQFIVRSTQIVTVTTTANYLYGKPVKGEVKLRYSYGLLSLLQDEFFQELVDGKVKSNIRLPPNQVPLNTPFNVSAEVIESNSGISETKEDTSAKFVYSPYKFDVSDSQTYFKPGLPYTVNVETLYANGSSAQNIPFYLEYMATTRTRRKESFKQLYETPGSFKQCVIQTSRFWIEFTITLTSADQRLDSSDQIKEQWLVLASKSETGTYLLLSLNTTLDGFTVGDFITMQVTTSRIYYKTSLYYMIIGKSKILKYDILPYNNGRWQISFEVTSDMIPVGRVIAYYERRNEIVADSRSFNVLDICGKPELQLSTSPAKKVHHPMTNVEIQLKGSPRATVGLSAVDKAVYLINDKNKLTRKLVKDTMKLGDLACSPGGGLHVGQVFYHAGFVIMTQDLDRTPATEINNILCSLKQITAEVSFGRYRRASDFCCISGRYRRGHNCKVAWQEFSYYRKTEFCRSAFMQCCNPAPELPPTRKVITSGEVDESENERTPSARLRQDAKSISPIFSLYFPESELFQEYRLNPSGLHKLNFTLPDSLTTWHIQGMSLSDTSPFCVSKPISLTTFKNVITKLNFPRVVKRLEQIYIKAVVYNYKTHPINVKVNFHETKEICSHAAPGKPFPVKLSIPAKDIGVAGVVIVPLKAGNFTIHIEVYEVESNTLEIIEKVLHVKYEGVKKTNSFSLMLDPSGTYSGHKRHRRHIFKDVTIPKNEISASQKMQRIIMKLTQPAEAIDGSAKGDIVITGNILGSTIQTTLKEPHKLLDKPYGCGEQTMIFLAPCVYILSYLNSTNQGSQVIYENATRYIRLGILREQEFRKMDGSYAAFDQNPSSVWLTAFVLKVFCQASEFEHVDSHLTKSAMTWLFQKQRLDGSFIEDYPVIHQEMVGGVNDRVMTAFVLISLMECGYKMHPVEIYRRKNEIDLAIRYLEKQMAVTYDTYDMAIISYALALADSSRKYEARIKLRSMAIENYDKGYLYWRVGGYSNVTAKKVSAWYHTEESYLSVEATAYALLTEMHYGEVEHVGPIVKWLIEQRNSAGMFKSTQDTVMALQALAEYGIKTITPDINLFFNLTSSRAHLHKHLTVNKETSLWSHIIPDVPMNDEVLIESMGIGSAQMELNMWYYRPPTQRETCHFNVTHIIMPIQKDVRRLIKRGCPLCGESCRNLNGPILRNWDVSDQTICMKIYLRYLGTSDPGMVVLDMDLLTGYDTHEELLEQLKLDRLIAKYHKHGNSRLTLYFNTIPFNKEIEIKLLMFRTMIYMNRLMPAPINVYVYYNATESCTKFYQLSREKDLINLLCDSSKKVCKCAQRDCVTCYESMSELVNIKLKFLEKKSCAKEQIVMIVNMTSTFDSSGTAYGFVQEDLSKTDIPDLEEHVAIFQKGICHCPHVKVGEIYLIMANKRVRTLDESNQYRHKFWVDSSGLMINKKNQFVKGEIDIFEQKARSLSRQAFCG